MDIDLIIAAVAGFSVAALGFLAWIQIRRARSSRLEMPSTIVAADLYRHWRASGPPCGHPEYLVSCDDDTRERWFKLGSYVKRTWGPLLILILLAGMWSCSGVSLKRGGMEFGFCAAEQVLVPSLGSLGAQLERRADWQTWGMERLGGALGGAALCGLRALATSLRADGISEGPREEEKVIRRLAARCGPTPSPGQCAGAEERAAWLLWKLSGKAWPASGEG